MLHLHLELLQHFHLTKCLAFAASQHMSRKKSRNLHHIHGVGKAPQHLVTLAVPQYQAGLSPLLKTVIFRAVVMTCCKTWVIEIFPLPHFVKQSLSQNWPFTPSTGVCVCPSLSQQASSCLPVPPAVPAGRAADQSFTWTFAPLPHTAGLSLAAP